MLMHLRNNLTHNTGGYISGTWSNWNLDEILSSPAHLDTTVKNMVDE